MALIQRSAGMHRSERERERGPPVSWGWRPADWLQSLWQQQGTQTRTQKKKALNTTSMTKPLALPPHLSWATLCRTKNIERLSVHLPHNSAAAPTVHKLCLELTFLNNIAQSSNKSTPHSLFDSGGDNSACFYPSRTFFFTEMTSTDQRGTWECQQALHWSWCPLVEGSDEMVPFLSRAMFASHGYPLPWILSSWAGLRCKQSRYKHHPRAAHKRGHVVWASSDKGDSCSFHLSALKRSPNSSTPNNSRLLRKVPMRNLFFFFFQQRSWWRLGLAQVMQ